MDQLDALSKIALPFYFVAYFMIAFAWRSYRVWRASGINPYVLSDSDDAYGYIGRWFKLLMLGTAFTVASFAWLGALPGILVPLQLPYGATVAITGWFLLFVSLVWIAIAQWHMGQSWRIGINTHNKTKLITSGLFSISRNPIFLGMRVNLLGFFFVLPSALTLLILLLGEILMQIQVRLEEPFLHEQHGLPYAAYCGHVRRWL